MRTNRLGENPRAVSPAESLTKDEREPLFLHLKMTSEAHQKLATLSSNRPRLNGNIRVMGSRMADRGAKGGRNGRKRRTKERVVTAAKRMNRRPLKSSC